MKTIWKFQLGVGRVTDVEMPDGARVLTAQAQAGRVYVWATVDPSVSLTSTRSFEIIGTGWDVDEAPRRYISTVQLSGGEFIFHVFERISILEALVTPVL